MRTIVNLIIEHDEPKVHPDYWKMDLLETLRSIMKGNGHRFTDITIKEVDIKLAKNRHATLYEASVLMSDDGTWHFFGIFLLENEAKKAAMHAYQVFEEAMEWRVEPILIKEKFEE